MVMAMVTDMVIHTVKSEKDNFKTAKILYLVFSQHLTMNLESQRAHSPLLAAGLASIK